MNRLSSGCALTSTGFSLALLFVCLGAGYYIVDHAQGDRYGQMRVLATEQELRDNPLLQSRATHAMMWIYRKPHVLGEFIGETP
ncbi:MAG: hypothetical protein JST89_03605 [Cyanobacteria bacterium SZAS-4]|nr:hypothetical protein [Cyanobacteria bacterium SZAS-4]